MKTSNDTIGVGVVHVLVVDNNVVLGRHVICNVVVDNQTKKSVQKSQIDLFIQLVQLALHHDIALAVRRLPNVLV